MYEVFGADGALLEELRETFPLRFIYRYELVHLLARSGFEIVKWYGDYDFSPFAEDSLGMIVVAKDAGESKPAESAETTEGLSRC